MSTLQFVSRLLGWAFLPVVVIAQDGVTIAVRGGEADVAIVQSAEASPSQRYAAAELQKFTEQMTGVKLAVVTDMAPLPAHAILLGDTRYTASILGKKADIASLGEDGFRMVSQPPHLMILGGPKRGVLYGVYEILERFGGCRWYSSWHCVIPQREVFSIPVIDETQTPAFALREPFWFDLFDGDLAARNKANGNAMRLEERHGGHSHRFGGGLGSCHTFEKLLPIETYFDTHPEYFSEVKGQRIKQHSQLCLTNPDVLRIVTSNVLACIRKDPGADFYGVSQNDWRNPCECPACRAIDEREGSHAGTMIAFVNAVAEAVEKEFPNVIIETLAYQYTRKPPKTLRPRHNVMPCLCTIECDFSKPLDVSTDAQNTNFVNDIRSWHAISPRLYLWDYTTNFRCYTAPSPNVFALQGNVKFFRDNGVNYLFEQGAYQGRHGEFAELKAWLLAKWLWNPDLPAEPLLKDFFEGYYGAAAPLIRKYFDELHTFYPQANKPWHIFSSITDPVIPDEFIVRAVALWKEAEAAVKESPALSYNVRMGAFSVLHARLARLPPFEQKKVWVTSQPQRYDIPSEYRSLATELLSCFDEAKNIRLSESRATSEKMLAYWRFLAQPFTPPKTDGQLRAIVEDRALSLGQRGTWGDTVADPLAEDGSALKLFNTHYEWCTTLSFTQVAFDPGKRYRIRMRVRVERESDKDGEAFWSGVYDTKNKKGCGGCTRNVAVVADGYQWYDVAEWVPEAGHNFWIGPGRFDKKLFKTNPAIKALYIDKLEITAL